MGRDRWTKGRWARREIPVIGSVALLVLGLGVLGWWQQDPAGSFLDHLYRSLQLFAVSYEGTDPVWPLQAARFLAVGVAFYAVLRVITAVLSSQITLYLATRDKGHSVLVGTGPEIRGLAQGIRRGASHGSVSVVGDLADDEAAQLTAQRIRVLSGLGERELDGVLRDASRVIVVGDSDDETVRLLSSVMPATSTADRTVVLESPDLTREWLRRPASGVHAVCRSTQVALETLRISPPYPAEHAVPPPLVIGDDLLATELVRRILVAGWRDGRRPAVHCLSVGPTFASALRGDGLDHSLRVSEEPCLTPARVAAAAQRVMEGWPPPPEGKGRSSGLRAYVALARGSDSLPVARALLRELPDARVAVIVDDAEHWTTSLGSNEDRLVWISRGTLLSDLSVLKRSSVDLLADEVAADARAWPPESPSIFGRLVRDTTGELIDVRPDDARVGVGIRRLVGNGARLAFEVLEAGGLDARPGARPCEPPIVGPARLREMAKILLSGMDGLLPTGPEATAWALETAARLPGLIQCAGWG
ncbi:hypothetical protein [Tessaracoccus defluvii]|uniref:NAD-binding protein n=2 Tax=Tessaracoccus defluvii TaxID=1285901 RepID=A0A7H0H2N6_9ACTN|nr:hypothetical protein [Tessaracoccus defluvii]QNP54802.1 hypothetical protein H9L22_10865 [Tessaracoccus defluvii]